MLVPARIRMHAPLAYALVLVIVSFLFRKLTMGTGFYISMGLGGITVLYAFVKASQITRHEWPYRWFNRTAIAVAFFVSGGFGVISYFAAVGLHASGFVSAATFVLSIILLAGLLLPLTFDVAAFAIWVYQRHVPPQPPINAEVFN